MVVGELAQERDVLIIGGGPGGYTAAIRAAQLGREVTLIEKAELGGICLNQGCIPSKVLAHVSSQYRELSNLDRFGIGISEPSFDLPQTMEFKRSITADLRKGVEALCRQNKIELVEGKASFLSADRIGVENGDDFQVFSFRSAVIAAGSSPARHRAAGPDHAQILDSRSLYTLETLPEHLIIYGNDYIAIEAAFSYRSLGCEVTLLHEKEFAGLDASIEKELTRVMKKAKIKRLKNRLLVQAENRNGKLGAAFKSEDGAIQEIEGTHLYMQTEMQGNSKELGLDRLGMDIDADGFIKVDHECRTSVEGIWAVGDITGGDQLAVKAITQAKAAASSIAGLPAEWNAGFMPRVIRSQPPVACSGMTEEEAKAAGYRVQTGIFPFAGNGFAAISGQKDGIVKVIADADHEVILGIHLMGSGASELISTGMTALEMAGRIEDLTFPLYPHPSLNEGLLEAVEDVLGHAIHKAPSKVPVRQN
ncbi:dihydrolipoyl dehydrogenase family protein [Metabacillus sp. 113a]|uniref:dihydrolipoyl dehydrogenase family protein n=1 Tax=Metabacillus sp. 113a TaxID=3404706 RepID=UPI003CE68912